MPAIVYILYSKTLDKYYVGCTTDILAERLRRHLSDHRGYTTKAKDWVVVYYETFEEKLNAFKREKEIKCWKSKERIKQLIHFHG